MSEIKTGKLRTLMLALIAATIPAILVMVVGEAICRIWVPDVVIRRMESAMYYGMMDFDPVLGRVLKKNFSGRILADGIDFSVSTNSLGLREHEIGLTKDPGVFRILALGDSFTFGYGVGQNESWPQKLEEILAERGPGGKVEVINAGVSGWGTFNEREYLLREGMKFSPDLVILGFYWNDVIDNISGGVVEDGASAWHSQQKNIKRVLEDKPLLRLGHWAADLSYFYTLVDDRIGVFKTNFRQKILAATGRGEIGGVVRPDYETSGLPDEGISLIDLTKMVPEDIMLEQWSFFASENTEVKLQVWRYNSARLGHELVGESDIKIVSNGQHQFDLTPPISTKKGDLLGMYVRGHEISRNLPHYGQKRYTTGDMKFIPDLAAQDRSSGYCFGAVGHFIHGTKPTEYPAYVNSSIRNQSDPYAVFRTPVPASLVKSWSDTMVLIKDMANLTHKNGSEFMVAYMPHFEEVEKQREGGGEPVPKAEIEKENDINLSLPREVLLQELHKHQIRAIDPTDQVRSSPEKLIYVRDTHFNAKGQKIVAQFIADEIAGTIAKKAASR